MKVWLLLLNGVCFLSRKVNSSSNEQNSLFRVLEKSEGAMTTAESVTSTESVVTVIAKGNNIGEESMVDLTQYSNGDVPEETVNESLMSLAGEKELLSILLWLL